MKNYFVIIGRYGTFDDAGKRNCMVVSDAESAALICGDLNDNPHSIYRTSPMVSELLNDCPDVSFSYEEVPFVVL